MLAGRAVFEQVLYLYFATWVRGVDKSWPADICGMWVVGAFAGYV